MTSPSEPMTDAPSSPPPLNATRPFYWSVRRELWENRFLYLAPLAVGALALSGLLLSTIGMAQRRLTTLQLPPAKQVALIVQPYDFAHGALMISSFIVAAVYCLGALHGERRDRSVLFWKSLPVSDITTVLSKAAVPMVIVPVVTVAVIMAAHLLMLAWSALMVAVRGEDLAVWWSHLPLMKLWPMLLGGLPFIAVWYAPVYGWLVMVSAWARRAPFLWAVAPPLALGLVERLAFGSDYVWHWLGLRLTGAFAGAFSGMGRGRHMAEVPDIGWDSPHVWTGLVIAVVFFAASVWLRRSRDPI
jgi:ABC-2 type transport system permease protein